MLPIRAAAIRRLPSTTAQSPLLRSSIPSQYNRVSALSARWKSNGGSDRSPSGSPKPRIPFEFKRPGSQKPAAPKSTPDSVKEPVGEEAEPIEAKSRKPLPDLRFGIPSTFEQEYSAGEKGKQGKGEQAEAEQDGPTFGGDRGDGGELPKSAYESSIDKRRNRTAQVFYVAFFAAATAGALWAGRDWENEAEAKRFPDAPSGWGAQLFYNRIRARIKDQMGYYTEPAFPKLLPTMDDNQLPPYTLVVSLEDMLVHSEWSREHGWRTAKRPGVDFFLLYLSQYFELVLFTSSPSGTADPVYRKLDPYHLIPWPLFREATRYEDGEYVKDLSYLNRPLEKTILVDSKAGHAKAQPENAIILKPWKGDPNDRELLSLIPFLEYVAVMGLEDVRSALKSFDGKHIPTEFAAREARMREAFAREHAAKQPKKASGGGLSSWVGGIVKSGPSSPDQPQSISEAMAQGKTLFDVMREEGMKRYRLMEKEIKENGEKWLKEEAEMMKRLEAEQMKSVKSNPLALFGLGGPPNIDPQKVMEDIKREEAEKAAAAASAAALEAANAKAQSAALK